MLSQTDDELLTRTGPGTSMGNWFRLFWLPVLLSSELPMIDSAPVRVRILSEDLVAFRNTQGEVGLIPERCPHRGASLYFGMNEDDGLRCVYHGWKFDVSGRCLEMPSESPASDFKNKVRVVSYPTQEHGGVIWAYMGPSDLIPAFPEVIWTVIPDSHRYVSKRIQETNYLQALEGGVDSSHISILHKGAFDYNVEGASDVKNYILNSAAPSYDVVETPFGALMGAGRDVDSGQIYWRTTAYLMPSLQMVCAYGDEPRNGHVWVPIDDENCMNWGINWHPTRALTGKEVQNFQKGLGIHTDMIPGTWKPVQNRENDYRIDRALQRSGRSNSGIKGVGTQDAAVQESQGRIYNRQKERLGKSDAAIIALRKILLRELKNFAQGMLPNRHPSNYAMVDPPAFVLDRTHSYQTEALHLIKNQEVLKGV